MKCSMLFFAAGILWIGASGAFADPILNSGNGIYYEEILQGGTWDEAKAYAEMLSYEGMTGRLAIVDSDETRQFLVNNVLGGSWHIEWVGAYQLDAALYNVDGTAFNTADLADNFDSGDPGVSDYGLAIKGSGYGGNLAGFDASFSGVGAFVVEYAAVPEPASAMLLFVGFGLMGLIRRFYGCS